MNLLLDSHVFLWWNAKDVRLDKTAKDAIAEPQNQVYVSASSIWEIAIKCALGQIKFSKPLVEAVGILGFQHLAIQPIHAEIAGGLPRHHGDPFDRLLIAQAKHENCVLVTHDRRMEPYGVPCLWT